LTYLQKNKYKYVIKLTFLSIFIDISKNKLWGMGEQMSISRFFWFDIFLDHFRINYIIRWKVIVIWSMQYYVYVIKLDDSVLQSRKFRKLNPHMNMELSCYYVGQSANHPETRFWQHKKGYKSNRFARDFGLGLCPQFYDHLNPIKTRKEAESIEAEITERLRSMGHGVWSH